ncbi:mediator of RNA polymerase II transcription subunit 15-like [Daphnia pulex]|uniref:mediator of RNA polymerase II transcription subunit 15-like n=1 Tax=Daphnia pulex TaxID=6669 RepID=UPI001EDFD5A8|nr:mediator of RNA polymerase II transcription subunit 15-like [Daphnia pulex]
MASDDWKSPGFRQNVAARIEEAIRQSGNPTTKTASEMETHFFQRANNKEDYLNYLARLLIHIKELSAKARAQGGTGVGVAGPQGNVQPNNPQQQGNISQPQMMNHMNVRPQMMQNMGGMDQQQQMNQMAPNQQQQQMNQMAPNQQQQQMNQQQHQQMNQMAMNQQQLNQQQQMNQQQMNQQQMNQMGVNQQQQQQLNQQQQMNQFNPNNNPNMNIGNPLMQQLGAPNQQQQQPQGNVVNNPSSALISQLNQNQQQQAMGPMGGGMPRPRFAGPTGVTATAKMTPQQQQQVQAQAQQQQQILNQQMLMQQQRKQQAEMIQNPTTPQQFVGGPGVPSPAQQQQQSMQQQQQQPMSSGMTSHMSAPSPAYVHSPGNVQLVSSPAAAARMGGQQQQQQQRSLSSLLPPPSPNMMNVPTPGGGGMLHTPQGAGMGGMGMTGAGGGMMGSGGGGTEEQMYLEKVRQLSRFIEPLTCLIGRIGDVDSEKLSKMKIMLDILSNPSKRMPMDTLLKCEAVLEKMDFKKSESGSVAPPSVASVPSLGVAVPVNNPPAATPLLSLLETIANQARSPYINHTLQRTFAPAVNSLIGCDIAAPAAPKKRLDSADDDKADELMYTIEREVANLYPRFKVDLDQLHLFGSQDLHLICRLEDKYLPSVPSLRIVVPRDYPRTAPFCDSRQPDYDVSGFTRTVLQGLSDRLRHMPHRFTVSQILNCWEMALRHACKPSNSSNDHASNRDVSALTVALGV